MEKLTVVKFGGSAIGVDGEGLPTILDRINHLKTDSKVIVVCSAPLTKIGEKKTFPYRRHAEFGKQYGLWR